MLSDISNGFYKNAAELKILFIFILIVQDNFQKLLLISLLHIQKETMIAET